MTKSEITGAACLLLAVVVYFMPTNIVIPGPTPGPGPDPTPIVEDRVHQAFVTYERLFRKHSVDVAAKLDSGELTTDVATHAAIKAGQEPMREISFKELGKYEQETIGDGKWTPELHSQLLKGYADVRSE